MPGKDRVGAWRWREEFRVQGGALAPQESQAVGLADLRRFFLRVARARPPSKPVQPVRSPQPAPMQKTTGFVVAAPAAGRAASDADMRRPATTQVRRPLSHADAQQLRPPLVELELPGCPG